jgi:hypothetical protein
MSAKAKRTQPLKVPPVAARGESDELARFEAEAVLIAEPSNLAF